MNRFNDFVLQRSMDYINKSRLHSGNPKTVDPAQQTPPSCPPHDYIHTHYRRHLELHTFLQSTVFRKYHFPPHPPLPATLLHTRHKVPDPHQYSRQRHRADGTQRVTCVYKQQCLLTGPTLIGSVPTDQAHYTVTVSMVCTVAVT